MKFDYIDANTLYPKLHNKKLEAIRQEAVNDLESFIRLVCKYQYIPHCHSDLCKWMMDIGTDYKLVIWPRDHGKSRYAAFYTAWRIVRDPSLTVIYVSATADKAEEMLDFIKTKIFETKEFKRYFSNMCHRDKGKRAQWANSRIKVDHPRRSERGIVDSTILAVGLNANITGKHANLLVLDDVVVDKNTLLEGDTGRKKVNKWVASMASIASVDDDMLVVGTRYHPEDAYDVMLNSKYDVYNDEGNIVGEKHTYNCNFKVIQEENEYLFPREFIPEMNASFGFDKQTEAKKRSQYEHMGQLNYFYSQYYNNPNSEALAPVDENCFRYYSQDKLEYVNGSWYLDNKILVVYASVDLAASDTNRSDYTAITIGGINSEGVRFLLKADRFKTDKQSEIEDRIEALYDKWKFFKLRIEAVSGFKLVANGLKLNLEQRGIRIPIDIYHPGNKEKNIRINSILEPLYASGSVYHYRGGNAEVLEKEILSLNPRNDDLKDAWAATVDPEFMKTPRKRRNMIAGNVVPINSKYGGIDYSTIRGR